MSVKLKHLSRFLRREEPLARLLPLLAALALAGLLLHMLNGRLRPVLATAASSQATNLMTQAIASAVDSCLQENSMDLS